ncbi:MAG TPA: ADYC domain-containing protein [Nevskia sp.]|nr:ADYC domain-containing protein [Nevskia sp.]
MSVHLFRRLILACAAWAWAWSASAAGAVGATPGLGVEGTALVLHQPDGRVLKGRQLQGRVLSVADGQGITEVKLLSIKPDPEHAWLLRHEFRVRDEHGHWSAYCEPDYAGETWGVPLAIPEGQPGREGPITLSCSSGAVVKCLRFGYAYWRRGPHGEDLAPYHAACVHMVRADYCGDGKPATKAGTMIHIYDKLGIKGAESDPEARRHPDFAFEAGWGPQGAVCAARTRWPDLLTLQQLHASCPRLAQAAACTPRSAADMGALVFNASHRKARIGE